LWKGEVVSGQLMMLVEIRYTMPTADKLGSWRGEGWSSDPWPCEIALETNIGSILVLDPLQIPGRNGLYKITFLGSGNPRGMLGEKWGFKTER